MRGRVALAWALCVCIAAGAVALVVTSGAPDDAAAGSLWETLTKTIHVEGQIGPQRSLQRVAFRTADHAHVTTTIEWPVRKPAVRATLHLDGAWIGPSDVRVRRHAVDREYDVNAARYEIWVTGSLRRNVPTKFDLTINVSWKHRKNQSGPTNPSPSPEPSAEPSPSPTAEPAPSPSPSPEPQPSSSPPPSPSGGGDWPVRIFSVGTARSGLGEALADPYVTGISVRFSWANLEPSPGDYRWSLVDDVLAQARSANKVAMLRVLSGIYAPDWVKQQVPTLTFADEYLYNPSAYPDTVTMPIPWDPDYLDRWQRFVTAFGARYDGNATIDSVQMAGGGFIGEMTLPTDTSKWLANGYTDDRYADCWKRIIGFYRAAFPATPIVLDIVEPFGGVLKTDVVDPVVAAAIADGTKKAWIQNNALRASALDFIGPYRQVIRSVGDRTTVGYQMIGDAPTVDSLHDAFTVALQDAARYVEVYASDVLDDANRPELHYLASGGAFSP